MKKTIKIKTIYGRVLTITISEQTSEYISGVDKFGTFVKLQLTDIQSCEPCKGGSNGY